MGRFRGKIIPVKKSEEEIDRYLNIREKTYDAINELVDKIAGDTHDSTMTQYYKDTEASFIFEFSTIKQLIDETSANGIRLYYGAAPDDEREPTVNKGSSTVVIVPVTITYNDDDTIKKVENIISTTDRGAIEYPGGVPTPVKPFVPTDLPHDVVNVTNDML